MSHHYRKSRKIIIVITTIVSALVAALMILSAYSGMLTPQNHPRLAVLPLTFPLLLAADILMLVVCFFVLKKLTIIPAAAMILCITDIRALCPINMPENVPDDAIKVLSMNIGGAAAEQKQKFIDYIIQQQADIICLQEVYWKGKWVDNEQVRAHYPHIITLSGKGKMSCVSRYPIIGTEQINYKSEGNMSAAFYVNINGDSVMVINNHFESYKFSKEELNKYREITGKNMSISKREEGSKDVVRKLMVGKKARGLQVDTVNEYMLANWKRHTILCGDFNETASEYAHFIFTKKLNDAFTRTGNGFGFTYSKNKLHFRIDHILCSEDIEPSKCFVDNSCDLSDHFPIISYLKLK